MVLHGVQSPHSLLPKDKGAGPQPKSGARSLLLP